jgi:hypothetical protein
LDDGLVLDLAQADVQEAVVVRHTHDARPF